MSNCLSIFKSSNLIVCSNPLRHPPHYKSSSLCLGLGVSPLIREKVSSKDYLVIYKTLDIYSVSSYWRLEKVGNLIITERLEPISSGCGWVFLSDNPNPEYRPGTLIIPENKEDFILNGGW